MLSPPTLASPTPPPNDASPAHSESGAQSPQQSPAAAPAEPLPEPARASELVLEVKAADASSVGVGFAFKSGANGALSIAVQLRVGDVAVPSNDSSSSDDSNSAQALPPPISVSEGEPVNNLSSPVWHSETPRGGPAPLLFGAALAESKEVCVFTGAC